MLCKYHLSLVSKHFHGPRRPTHALPQPLGLGGPSLHDADRIIFIDLAGPGLCRRMQNLVP